MIRLTSERTLLRPAGRELRPIVVNGESGLALYEFAAVRAQFSDEELVNLTLAITTINAWNRLCVSFRVVPGTYQREVTSVSVSSSRSQA